MKNYNALALTDNIEPFLNSEYFLVDWDSGEPKLASIANPEQAICLVFTCSHSNYSIYIQREVLNFVRQRGYRWEHQLKRKGKQFIKEQGDGPLRKRNAEAIPLYIAVYSVTYAKVTVCVIGAIGIVIINAHFKASFFLIEKNVIKTQRQVSKSIVRKSYYW